MRDRYRLPSESVRLDTLRAFCASADDTREWLQWPMAYGQYAYACNGFMICRTLLHGMHEGIDIHVGAASLRDMIDDIAAIRGEEYRAEHVAAHTKIAGCGVAGLVAFSLDALRLLPPGSIIRVNSQDAPSYWHADAFDGLIMPVRLAEVESC